MQYNAFSISASEPQVSPDPRQVLKDIGNRVRRLRAQRGMSRRVLAQSSGVSERYLATLEQGKANISIVRLVEIANAMGLPVAELLTEPLEAGSEYRYLRQYIAAAAPAELTRLYKALVAEAEVSKRVVGLIGLRGAGKSTVGAALAKHFDVPFVELVSLIEGAAGMAVSEIFSLGGQALYRRYERGTLDDVLAGGNAGILAIGGSLVSEPTSFERLLSSCVTVWLRAAPEDHMSRVRAQGDNRPMAGHVDAMDELRQILVEREHLYQRADYTIDTSQCAVRDAVVTLAKLPLVVDALS